MIILQRSKSEKQRYLEHEGKRYVAIDATVQARGMGRAEHEGWAANHRGTAKILTCCSNDNTFLVTNRAKLTGCPKLPEV